MSTAEAGLRVALRAMARRVWRERRKAKTMTRFASRAATGADLDRAEADERVAALQSLLAREKTRNATLRAERAAVDYVEAVTGSTACGEAALRLRRAAAGRREYMSGDGGPFDRALAAQADTIESCARIVEGDLTPLRWWLPSWRWDDEMLG